MPEPGEAAKRHGGLVRERLATEIAQAGGWISFARYMETVLYAPALGYYAAGAAKLGEAGDFVTAPEISPLFGETLAGQLAELIGEAGGDVLELGAGSGRLAVDVLRALQARGDLPARYLILEVSPELAQRQRGLLGRECPALVDRISWIDAVPARFEGAIVANEVLDALPVHLVHWRADGIHERGVTWDKGLLAWEDRLADGPLLEAARGLAVMPPYLSEISLAARALVATLASRLTRGALLFIDYGFGRAEYYHPQRSEGTLMCHYRHRAHGDPFFLPGLQDITAHVDFTAIAEAGIDAGLKLLGYATQARFLVNAGLLQHLAQNPPANNLSYLPAAAGVQKLLSPAEMGELFKVIALGPHGMAAPSGFASGDLSRTL